uniref:Myoferlin n=1 Tax=Sinocyclocheilus rhinocerous TaxID=307959 RepID=A0A673LDV8_9TELE
MLRVAVESAAGLPKKKLGSPDPIASVVFKDEKKKTKTVSSELNPVWNETLEFDLKGVPLDSSSYIDVIVKDYETLCKDKLIGSAKVSLKDLASSQVKSLPVKNLALVDENGKSIGANISMTIGYEPPAGAVTNPQDQQDGGNTAGGEEGDVTDGGGQGAVTSPGEPGHKIRSRTRKRHSLANKPQDFQIRVRVIEGRQLPGNNIKPVVKVHVCGETHRTRIRKGNNPYFDEVYNSNSFRADCLMGEFKLDIGYIYDEPAHCIMKKWILLNDPDDSSSGAKGYLKVSMFVLGTGDEPPVERKEQDNDKDDVESNLLLPAGVALRWVTLKLKVFRAEDVPQMDDSITQTLKEAFGGQENKKNLVDPYVEAWFAGKKLCTQIIEKNANPEWNQQLNLQVKFPSMCERIKLTVFDWDRLSGNDAIGTTYLDLTKIASSGGEIEGETGNSEMGFLPTFGPCYINLYGSPREFSALSDPYEDLNLGKGEGAAYRGRILVELSTKLDGKADKSVEEIPSDDILVVQVRLLVEFPYKVVFPLDAFIYALLLSVCNGPNIICGVKFCLVLPGNNYYYLPWADTKPVIAITSFWEDISHRLDSLNTILYISNCLQTNLSALKSAVQSKATDARLVEIWLKLINQLMEDISSFRIPDMEGKPNLTALDIQQKMLRDSALENIMKGAKHLFEEATDVNKCLSVIEDWLDKLKQLAEEPQNSMPDVIIWMLRGEKRVAYTRIPAHQVLYSSYSEQACGQYCGKTKTVFMKYPMDNKKGLKIPVQLRVNMWLGLATEEKKFNHYAEGIFNVFAELYENQAQVLGKWGTTGLLNRSKFSDVTGKVKLKQEYFLPPVGWEWEGDWRVDPEKTSEYTPHIFANILLYLFILGWEYGVTIPPDDKPKSWVAAEKMYHVHRRKRMIRPRKRIPGAKTAADGWEYSSLIGWKFHRKQRSSDTFRRRRWRRKMTPADRVGASAIFKLEGALGDEKGTKTETSVKQFGANTPTVSCTFDQSNTYHLRVYVYQARNLTALDKDSFSDPYVHVSFLHHSQTTETIRSTLNPTWDQTLIFKNVEIYGDPQSLAQNPPIVVMEIFDSDQVGKDEMLGRSTCVPIVKLTSGMDASPKLHWEPVTHKNGPAGEILVAAELILKTKGNDTELPLIPPKRGEKLYMVPQGVRPVVQLTAIEVLAWGLRNMKTYQLAPVTSPSLVVECGGERVQTAVIKNMKKCPNFAGNVLLLKVLLPKEEMYTPPIVLKVIDHRPFGRKPVVGQCTINFLEEFRCDPYATVAEVAMSSKASPRDLHVNIDDGRQHLLEAQKETVDWWSKFYASVGESERCRPYLDKGYDTLEVYDHELESAKEFMGLTDFCSTFKLQRGKNESDDDDPAVVGEFKGSFKVYPLPDDPGVPPPPQQFRELPDSVSQECVVRIYVVQAIDLQPKDNNGKCDPYIKISLGKKSIDDRDNYVPYTLNPVFGRMFELTCFLPQDKDLKIAIYDFDLLSRDEKVGETVIDLENRLLSRFGSYCGLAQTYCISGPNHWRDQLNPSKILEQLARWKGLSPPRSEDNGNTLSFGGRLYCLSDLEANKEIHEHLGPPSERIALHVLRTQGLVPEHVETRTLYSSFQPTLPQGKLQMWVDIFPKSLGPPGPPFDISPRKPKKYFLRVIVWNTTDVVLDETSITGENMSDIYVKGWMPGMEEDKQKTDVHYRSLDGDGNFSWRFVFGFEYLPAEQLCLVSKKEYFWSLDKSEFRIPPKLIVQIWDNDKFSLDDYLGAIELDLHHLINPSKTPEKCSLSMVPDGTTPPKSDQLKSLFDQKAVRGWWPCYMDKDGKRELGGKVELTLEIVNEKEADERPAGKGRDEPNMNPKLDPPKRPDTSFFWFTNPCKTCRFIVWRRFKWLFIGLVVLILVLLFIGILLYSLPNYISMKIVKPFN